MYLYKTTTFPHQPLRSISKVAVLHRFYWSKESALFTTHPAVLGTYGKESRHLVYNTEVEMSMHIHSSELHFCYIAGVFGPHQAKSVYEHAQYTQIRSPCACVKISPGPCSSFIYSVVSNDSFSGQWRPWSDCADARPYLGLRCPNLPKGTFLQSAARLTYA